MKCLEKLHRNHENTSICSSSAFFNVVVLCWGAGAHEGKLPRWSLDDLDFFKNESTNLLF